MKSIKYFLAAFVVSAMFASCAKEEITVAPENEIVGTELIGTNISVNFGMGVDTKITAGGKWDENDKLGLGWLKNGDAPVDELYDNHLFQLFDGEELSTKGNVYRGWYFGYYPFAYTEDPGQKLTVNINPTQTQKGNVDRYSSSLWLSPKVYLTKDSLNPETHQLLTKIDMFQANKSIVVNVTPDQSILGKEALKNLRITKIKADAGLNNALFVHGDVIINPSKLGVLYKDKYNNYDDVKITSEMYKSLTRGQALEYVRHSEVEVNVNNNEINLTAPQTLRINVMPREKPVALDVEDVKFTIFVENGYFEVAYTPVTEDYPVLTAVEQNNNEYIQKLVENYAAGKVLSSYLDPEGNFYEGVELNFTLTADMFKQAFNNINSESAWDKAVAVVNTLNLKEVTFTITPNEDDDQWSFTEVDNEGNLITLPSNTKVNVTGEPIIIGANGEWPAAGIKAEEVVVNQYKTLTVDDGVTLDAEVDNNGTITVGKESIVRTVDNYHGRIEVVNGSIVILDKSASGKGTIAYTLTGNDKASEINELTAPVNKTDELVAEVNTLVVNEGITFNLSMKDADAGTIYNPVVGQKLERMLTTNFELNNGTIIADAGKQVRVNNVKIKGGDNNKIFNVNIDGSLTINSGNVNVDATIIGGTTKESLVIKNIYNYSSLSANTDIYTKYISNPAGASTTVNSINSIFYIDSYVQGGTANGNISKTSLTGACDYIVYDGTKKLRDIIHSNDFKEGSIILLNAQSQIEITGQTDNTLQKTFTLVGTDVCNKIKVESKGLKLGGLSTTKTVNLKNLVIDANGSYALYAKEYTKLNLLNVNIVNTGDMSILVENASSRMAQNKTYVNAYEVTIPEETTIDLFTLFKGYKYTENSVVKTYTGKPSYIYFNYVNALNGNILDDIIQPQDDTQAISTGDNMFVNGVALPASK